MFNVLEDMFNGVRYKKTIIANWVITVVLFVATAAGVFIYGVVEEISFDDITGNETVDLLLISLGCGLIAGSCITFIRGVVNSFLRTFVTPEVVDLFSPVDIRNAFPLMWLVFVFAFRVIVEFVLAGLRTLKILIADGIYVIGKGWKEDLTRVQ